MATVGSKLAGLCATLGSLPGGAFVNIATSYLFNFAECGSVRAACEGLPGGTTIPVACILGALGLAAGANALQQKQAALAAALKLEQQQKQLDTIERVLQELREMLAAESAEPLGESDIHAFASALEKEDLSAVPDGIAQRMLLTLGTAGLATEASLMELQDYVKETWRRSLLTWEEQHAHSQWVRSWATTVDATLAAIRKEQADQFGDVLEAVWAIYRVLQDRETSGGGPESLLRTLHAGDGEISPARAGHLARAYAFSRRMEATRIVEGVRFRLVPAGMSPSRKRIDFPFYIAERLLTLQGKYVLSGRKTEPRSAEVPWLDMSWEEVSQFLECARAQGHDVRLPTSEEWRFVLEAGGMGLQRRNGFGVDDLSRDMRQFVSIPSDTCGSWGRCGADLAQVIPAVLPDQRFDDTGIRLVLSATRRRA